LFSNSFQRLKRGLLQRVSRTFYEVMTLIKQYDSISWASSLDLKSAGDLDFFIKSVTVLILTIIMLNTVKYSPYFKLIHASVTQTMV